MDSQFEFILAREAQLMYRRARDFEPANGDLTKWHGSIPGRLPSQNIKFEVEISIPPEFPRRPPQVTMITPTSHPQVDPATGKVNLRILTYWRPEYHLYQVVNSIKGLFARIPPQLPDTFASKLIPLKSQPSTSKKPVKTPIPHQKSPIIAPPSSIHPPPDSKTADLAEKPLIPEESPKILELKDQIARLESELASLQHSLLSKEEEVARLEGRMDVHNIPKRGAVNEIILPQDPKNKQILDLQSEKIALEDLIRTLEDKFEIGEINATEYSKLYKSYQKQLFLVKQKLKELGIN